MTFNENADISGRRVGSRGGGKTGGIALGGMGGLAVIVLLVFQLLSGEPLDMELLSPEQGQFQPSDGTESIDTCLTGADANERVDCRMQATAYSLDDFWAKTLPEQAGIEYVMPGMVLFSGSVQTACGNASSAVGPFYCPGDETVYLDTDFFQELTSQFGASEGPLAELYVVAHEFGHHIQNQTGSMDKADRSETGPTSDAVRLELQADCYAGMWVAGASQTTDVNGVTYLQEPTAEQIRQALSAAAAVGDDHIQEAFSGEVTPHTWTHGSSEQRQHWFEVGMQGSMESCDTFAVSGDDL